MTSPGKQRGLDTLATPEGVFAILAIDHRDSLRAVVPGDPSDVELTGFKLDLIRRVGTAASGVMLEPELSLPQAIEEGALAGDVGFTAALEAQGYLDDPWSDPIKLMSGFTALDAKKVGAGAAKLLLPYSPDRPEHAGEQRRVVAEIAGLCAELDLALLVEPVAFGMAPYDRPRVVAESVRQLTGMGIDLLKVEFPGDPGEPDGWAAACAEVDAAADVPWVLLSSGVTFEQYEAQLRVAFEHGCSGFTGGRAIWKEAALADGFERPNILQEIVVPRVQRLRELAVDTAQPWRKT
jgi:tagatose-1,6-bisphosphate aldolase